MSTERDNFFASLASGSSSAMEGITGSRWGNETEQNERTDERRKRKKGFYRLIRSRTIIVGRRTDTGRPLIHPIRSIVRSCACSGRRRPRDADSRVPFGISVCLSATPSVLLSLPLRHSNSLEQQRKRSGVRRAGGLRKGCLFSRFLARSPLRSFAPIFAYSAHLSDEMEAKKVGLPARPSAYDLF